MVSSIPSFLRSAAPVAAAPAPPGPRPAAATPVPFVLDLFAPSTAAVTQVTAVRRAPTLDDLEGPIGGGAYLPTTMPGEPTGGSMNYGLISAGACGPEVERLQRALAARGFNPGTPDGVFGPDTERALRRFQAAAAGRLAADGIFGPASRRALLGQVGPASLPSAPVSRAPAPESSNVIARLQRGVRNGYTGSRHNCFRYSWSLISIAGGRSIGNARESRAGLGRDTAHIQPLVNNGQIVPGDVIYVNRSPGADPSSTNLRYGPHWFVYMGNNKFADQYGIRGAQAMADFVPGRKIDTIFRTMA